MKDRWLITFTFVVGLLTFASAMLGGYLGMTRRPCVPVDGGSK